MLHGATALGVKYSPYVAKQHFTVDVTNRHNTVFQDHLSIIYTSCTGSAEIKRLDGQDIVTMMMIKIKQ